ncbi:MAG: hypothetical protein EHM71_06405 [Zetaproteobacteria bacterium]|nr:MAG: hypothetical protein EHM71_06405 [Zetaproteobacteria bacterium]
MASVRKFPDRKKPFGVAWREPGTKTQRWRYFATKREADAFRDTVSTEVRQNTYVDPRPIPFKTYSTDWLARTQPTVSANTHALHEWAVNGYLIPAFNMMAVQALRPDQIERWQAAPVAGQTRTAQRADHPWRAPYDPGGRGRQGSHFRKPAGQGPPFRGSRAGVALSRHRTTAATLRKGRRVLRRAVLDHGVCWPEGRRGDRAPVA